MNSSTMDNISEAQTDASSIQPPSAHHVTQHLTRTASISQEPIFETDNKNGHNEHNNDETNVRFCDFNSI